MVPNRNLPFVLHSALHPEMTGETIAHWVYLEENYLERREEEVY